MCARGLFGFVNLTLLLERKSLDIALERFRLKGRLSCGGSAMSTKVKRKEEYEGRVKQALGVLNDVSNDNTTPRNIRRAAKSAMDMLQVGDLSLGVRAANAISILDDISQDPNMPPYTRVKIWNSVSILEAIKD